MGQAASLEAAQRYVERDFSSRLLLSHGLFHSPYPAGSYLLCEVDFTGEVALKPRSEAGTALVFQVIILDDEPAKASSELRGNEEPLKEKEKELNGTVDGTVTDLDPHQANNFVEDNEDQQATNSSCPEANNRFTSFIEQFVQKIIAKLAPAVSITPVSFEQLIHDIEKFQNHDQEVSTGSSVKEVRAELPLIASAISNREHTTLEELLRSADTRHPNFVPLIGAYKGEGVIYLLFPPAPVTLESILHFSPSALGSEDHIRLLLFEILSALAHCHSLKVNHGNLRPWNVLIRDSTWCWLTGFGKCLLQGQAVKREEYMERILVSSLAENTEFNCISGQGGLVNLIGVHSSCDLESEYSISVGGSLVDYKGSSLLAEARLSKNKDWRVVLKRWWAGELSNYDYLLFLNKLAGRRWGDRCFHTVMPWVIDFSAKPDTGISKGWRDLSKSKWRLAKGDEQLDFTYASAEMPHHVSDECLSELAVCIYKARRLPLLVLRRIVRSVYEPNEYPASMKRLYQWTPDECIPEFYSDPDVFQSIHAGMNNLVVPSWSQSAEEFICLHREALESDRVSQQLHHWIDLTFGYKLSGQAAIDAKNVTLVSSSPTVPRCSGRRQLFFTPHPRRKEQNIIPLVSKCAVKERDSRRESVPTSTLGVGKKLFEEEQAVQRARRRSLGDTPNHQSSGTFERASDHFRRVAPLEELVESSFFCESARHLSPCYFPVRASLPRADSLENIPIQGSLDKVQNKLSRAPSLGLPNKDECAPWASSLLFQVHRLAQIRSGDLHQLVNCLKLVGSEDDRNLKYLVWWEALRLQECPRSEGEAVDVFAAACIIAEIYLRKPLFDPVSMAAFETTGVLPGSLEQLPPSVLSLVKPALHPDFQLRPSAEMLLKSPFFSNQIRAVYSFLAPLHSLEHQHERLQYAATMADLGTFQNLGCAATEMVAPCCLSLVVSPCPGIDPTEVVCLLRELLRAMQPHAVKKLLVPVIQQLLQSQDFPTVQLAVLQPDFLREIAKVVGTAGYLEHFHFLVLANLRRSPDGRLEEAAAEVLISMSLHLGLPITLHQTLTPLMLSLGREMTMTGIDALLEIGERLGERVLVEHILPSVRSILSVGLELAIQDRVVPAQNFRPAAMIDAMSVLDRIIVLLPLSVLLTELLQEPHNVYTRIIMQPKMSLNLLQCAANALLLVCQHVGPDITVDCVLPQLIPLFNEVAFGHENSLESSTTQRRKMNTSSSQSSQPLLEANKSASSRVSTCSNVEVTSHSISKDRAALVNILYPGLALLLGIEKLRQCLITWLLLEQALLKYFNWKWGDISNGQSKSKEMLTPNVDARLEFLSHCNPANLLLDGVGWSIPQSQAQKWKRSRKIVHSQSDTISDSLQSGDVETSSNEEEPWFWVPGKAENLGSLESLTRGGLGLAKDEQPWELNAVILHSFRVHSGAMRSIAVMEDENTVFTGGGGGGGGSRGGSVVRQWKLGTSECCMEYGGHQGAVIDISLLPGNRVASCDGSLHLWSAQTGEQLAVFDEMPTATPSTVITNLMNSSIEGGRLPSNGRNSLGGTSTIGGLSASLSGGHVYTCLHSMEVEERLVTGTIHGSLRFFDIVEGRRLFMWRCKPGESSMSSYVSAITSSGQRKWHDGSTKYALPSAWVAVGFNSGECRLLDYRSGNLVVNWRAHDASITKLDVLDDNYLVSSSIDRTLSLWDLRRGLPTQLQSFRGHLDGVTSFALRGADMLSAAGNKIGLSSLSKSPQSGQERQVVQPQKLYTAQWNTRSYSHIVSISVLPYSRLFLLGTEDGFLKVCT